MKVLILGCGYTGERLAHWLLAQGVELHITTRTGTPPAMVSAPCFAFAWTSDAPPTPLDSAALAGVTHVLSTIPPDQQGVDPVIAGLLPALAGLGLSWFGYLSTTGVYGDTQGAWVDEMGPLQPRTQRSQHRVAAETAFLQSALPTHIFRLPGIYGPGRSVLDRLRQGQAQSIDKPGHVFSRIHVDDIVQTLWASMQQPHPGRIYNVCDDEPSEPSALVEWGAKLLTMQPPEAIPFAQVRMSPMGASFWGECRRVANTRIKTELGVRLLYPSYREGLQAIAAAEQGRSTQPLTTSQG